MTSLNITPIKIGIKFEPASLILVYNEKGKLRNRKIPTKNFDLLTDLRLFVKKFKNDEKYKKYFEKISDTKLEKMLFMLQDNMKGYTLQESLDRARKYDKSLDDTDITSEINSIYKSKNKEYDDDDFHDTEDEDEKNQQSVSTIEEVKAKAEKQLLNNEKKLSFNSEENKNTISKSASLKLLSTQIQSVKNNVYDFEDEVEDQISENKYNFDDEDEDNILNFAKKNEEKIETGNKDEDSSDSSF